jgi:type I site-specific restriction endonuclease|tara:strand:+ start:146 stop:475 length:330 start_codon:yes stop_codon:yes gene_type:complete
MQRRNFKDAMNEMCDHTVAKIQEHSETLIRLDKEQKGALLKFGSIEMETDFPRTVLYAILNRVVQDFKPRNDKYKDVMEKILNTLEAKEDKFAVQKELIKKFADEAIKK